MRLTINIEFGSLGDKTGRARSWVEDGVRNILIDPSRHSSASEVMWTVNHELAHTSFHVKNIWDKEKRARRDTQAAENARFNRAVAAVLGFDVEAKVIDSIIDPTRHG